VGIPPGHRSARPGGPLGTRLSRFRSRWRTGRTGRRLGRRPASRFSRTRGRRRTGRRLGRRLASPFRGGGDRGGFGRRGRGGGSVGGWIGRGVGGVFGGHGSCLTPGTGSAPCGDPGKPGRSTRAVGERGGANGGGGVYKAAGTWNWAHRGGSNGDRHREPGDRGDGQDV
jgi:hypothetical protein